MKNLWSQKQAREIIKYYKKKNINADLALRIYSSRLLGTNPKLVLHGGGNTSLKVLKDKSDNLMHVKGSGWDLSNIEPEGLPAIKLDPLKDLISLDELSDEDMVSFQREQLINKKSPNPSVETLLHAFLPHRFIDHTHSNAILSLTDQKDGYKRAKDLYGDSVGIVPYVMPGFKLAKSCANIFKKNVSVKGLILLKHGIFTFGDNAKESYKNMIDLVTKAENVIRNSSNRMILLNKSTFSKKVEKDKLTSIIRSEVFKLSNKKMLVRYVNDPLTKKASMGLNLKYYAKSGPATPDHAIRIKPFSMILNGIGRVNENNLVHYTNKKLKEFSQDYIKYFNKYKNRSSSEVTQLDSIPRVIFYPGHGAFVLAENIKSLKIVEDLTKTFSEVVLGAEKIGKFVSINRKDQFDIEYWSLEQSKLGKSIALPLKGNIVLITGGLGTIGMAIAKSFKKEGAQVVIIDKDRKNFKDIKIQSEFNYFQCDLTSSFSIKKCFKSIFNEFGGMDILISNAGVAWQGPIGNVDEKILRKSFEINFWSHQRVSQEAIKVLMRQNMGGVLLYNISKQSLNPGKHFGPYGIPKSSTMALMKQYAIDYASHKIRSNAVNADRIRSGILNDKLVKARSKARGVSESKYMSDNLLGLEVRASDVAQAFLTLALAERTTGNIIAVDGGNIAAAPR